MKCKICDKEVTCTCLCGFCMDCIKKFGHDKCTEILIEKSKKKNGNKNKAKQI